MIQLLSALGLICIVVALMAALRHTDDPDPALTKQGSPRQKVLTAGAILGFALGTVLIATSVLGLFVSPSSASTLSHHAPAHHAPARLAPLGPGRIVEMALAPGDQGYWEVTNTGVVYAFGSANFYGDLVTAHVRPPAPVIGIVPTNNGRGYYLVDSAHSMVWPFGDAALFPQVPSIPVAPPSGGSSPLLPLVVVLVLLVAAGFGGRYGWKRLRGMAQAPLRHLALGSPVPTVAPEAFARSVPQAQRSKSPVRAPDDEIPSDDWEWDS